MLADLRTMAPPSRGQHDTGVPQALDRVLIDPHGDRLDPAERIRQIRLFPAVGHEYVGPGEFLCDLTDIGDGHIEIRGSPERITDGSVVVRMQNDVQGRHSPAVSASQTSPTAPSSSEPAQIRISPRAPTPAAVNTDRMR